MKRGGGLITRADLEAYRPQARVPLRGTYRGYDVLAMPPISSGGTALVEMLNILEGYDLKAKGFGSADTVHLHGGGDAPRLRRPRALPRRPRGQPGHAHRAPHLQGVRAHALRATIDEKQASRLVARALRVAGGEPRDDAPLRDRRRPQRGRADLHPRGQLRLARSSSPGRASSSTTRWATSTRGRASPTARGPHRHRAQPGRSRQADALEHDPDHPQRRTARCSSPSAAPAAARSSTPCSR